MPAGHPLRLICIGINLINMGDNLDTAEVNILGLQMQ
jgi:hypothetical protein